VLLLFRVIASAQWIKTNHNCKKLIVAAPVAPRDTFNILKNSADEIIVLYTPDPFISIGRFYEEFDQVSDEQVKEIMRKYGYRT
jgi:putative phosphoribosyl transferase